MIATLRVDWIKKYPGELDKLPSNSMLRRKLDLMTAGRYRFGTAFNCSSNESVSKRFHDVRPAFAPGEEVQVDSTLMDLLLHLPLREPEKDVTKGTHARTRRLGMRPGRNPPSSRQAVEYPHSTLR